MSNKVRIVALSDHGRRIVKECYDDVEMLPEYICTLRKKAKVWKNAKIEAIIFLYIPFFEYEKLYLSKKEKRTFTEMLAMDSDELLPIISDIWRKSEWVKKCHELSIPYVPDLSTREGVLKDSIRTHKQELSILYKELNELITTN